MPRVPQNYVPTYLSSKSKRKASGELKRSRRSYKKGKYYTRKKISGYKTRKSRWANRTSRIYNLKSKTISMNELSKKTKCSRTALEKIVKKGQGAYYSSGSRPNQTAHSWGKARLYSAISGGPAAKVDRHILVEGCKSTSKALRLSKKAMVPNKKTIKIGGRK